MFAPDLCFGLQNVFIRIFFMFLEDGICFIQDNNIFRYIYEVPNGKHLHDRIILSKRGGLGPYK